MKTIYLLLSGPYYDSSYVVVKAFQYMTGLEDYVNENYKAVLDQESFEKYGEYFWEDMVGNYWYKVAKVIYVE